MHYDQHKYEEGKLVSLLAQDSEYAFQLIYDRYRNRIYQTAIRYLKSPLLAQELVQDVFLKLWLERKHLKQDLPVEAWLYTVAKNNLLNRIKKIAHDWKAISYLKLTAPQIVNNTDDKLRNTQYNELLKKAIEGMSEQQQKVFYLARCEQLTYLQIAEKIGISPLTVKTHMSRALEHIKKHLLSNGEVLFFILLFRLANFFKNLYS